MTVDEKIDRIRPLADLMPAVVVIHQVGDFRPVYISQKGFSNLGLTQEELTNIDGKYFEKLLGRQEKEEILEKYKLLTKHKDPKESFTLFQRVRIQGQEEMVWHITCVRIFYRNGKGDVTHTISVSFPVDRMKHIPNKAERLFAESEFFRRNLSKYLSLGQRAQEVLRLVALGKSSAEIAEELSISVETVNTHRKKIKQKLGISSNYGFTEYAHAFNLI